MIYVVLGMHKSGTTLVARLLHEAGIDMGDFDEELAYGEGNKYERREAQTANRKILRGSLVPPLDYALQRGRSPLVDKAGFPVNRDSQAYVRTRALARRLAAPEAESEVRSVVEACQGRHTDWGFKDPRTCLTYPVWQRVLPEHRLVLVFRGLGQILERAGAGVRHPLRSLRVLHAWTVHNAMILRYAQQSALPRLVLRYEELMSDERELERLSSFIGRPLHDVRDEGLYRRRSDPAPPAWTRALGPFLPMAPRDLEAQLGGLTA